MTTIDKLNELFPHPGDLYGGEVKDDVTIVNVDSRDPLCNDYDQRTESITVRFDNSLFKSHCYSGSYGAEAWTPWNSVEEEVIVQYKYTNNETTYY